MSTALVVRDDAGALERAERPSIVTNMNFEQIVGMGDQLVRTGFLPKHVKNGAQAAAIVLAGQELGMPPMRALRSLMLVEGKVVENADSQLSRFKADGGRAVFKQLDEQGAVLWLRHPNGDEHEESFSIDDARRAKLLGKDVWQKYPRAMLRSRVITAGLKSIGWEGGVGAYDPDEAAAFAPPSAQSGVAAVSRATDGREATDDAADVTDISDMTEVDDGPASSAAPARDIAWARAFKLPFRKSPSFGKPLGEFSIDGLESIASWILDKRKENHEPELHADLLYAIRLVVADVESQQATLPLEAAVAAKAEPVDTTLAPGKVEDALDTRTTARPATPAPAASADAPSIAALTKRMNKLLQHEKLTKAEREDFLTRAADAKSIDDLQRLVIELEEVIASPI